MSHITCVKFDFELFKATFNLLLPLMLNDCTNSTGYYSFNCEDEKNNLGNRLKFYAEK